jgi:hypothetical protein
MLWCVLASALAVADPARPVEQALETLRQIEALEGEARPSSEAYHARVKRLAEGLVAELGEAGFLVACVEASAAGFRNGADITERYRPLMLMGGAPLPPAGVVETLCPLWPGADRALRHVILRCLGSIEKGSGLDGEGGVDFSAHRALLLGGTLDDRRRTAIIDYLFDRAPWEALMLMLQLEGGMEARVRALRENEVALKRAYQKVLTVEAVFDLLVAPAGPVLREMAEHGGRWEAVLVAEYLQWIPAFRDAEMEAWIRRHGEALADARLDTPDPRAELKRERMAPLNERLRSAP